MDQLEHNDCQRRAVSRSDSRCASDKTRTFPCPRPVAGLANVLKHKPGPAQALAEHEMMSPTDNARGLVEETKASSMPGQPRPSCEQPCLAPTHDPPQARFTR